MEGRKKGKGRREKGEGRRETTYAKAKVDKKIKGVRSLKFKVSLLRASNGLKGEAE